MWGFRFTVWRVHSQVDGYVRNAFIASRDSVRFRLDFTADLVEVDELLSLAVQKFSIFYCIYCY